jgi:holo-[acyl-carrier protein] synthase
MILGIGTDIIEIARIKRSIEKYQQRFLDRLFTSAEQAYCFSHKNPFPCFAARFAAKEAVAKALGTGLSTLSWLDIEICRNKQGKPFVSLSPQADQLFNFPKLQLSISHCRTYATAVAIWDSDI